MPSRQTCGRYSTGTRRRGRSTTRSTARRSTPSRHGASTAATASAPSSSGCGGRGRRGHRALWPERVDDDRQLQGVGRERGSVGSTCRRSCCGVGTTSAPTHRRPEPHGGNPRRAPRDAPRELSHARARGDRGYIAVVGALLAGARTRARPSATPFGSSTSTTRRRRPTRGDTRRAGSALARLRP